jgi:DNA-3-methyladenine glycosylase
MSLSAPLPASFFERPVLDVAADLIGCAFLYRGVGGRIVETEAYREDDTVSHSHRGKTARNAVMFGPPGRLYVYFTYGMHFCANLVCGPEGTASAVLLRALEPQEGLDRMKARRGIDDERLLCSGPARLCQALGIGRAENGLEATHEPLVVLPRASGVDPAPRSKQPRIVITPRVGVRGHPAPWRFVDADSAFLSRRLPRGV